MAEHPGRSAETVWLQLPGGAIIAGTTLVPTVAATSRVRVLHCYVSGITSGNGTFSLVDSTLAGGGAGAAFWRAAYAAGFSAAQDYDFSPGKLLAPGAGVVLFSPGIGAADLLVVGVTYVVGRAPA